MICPLRVANTTWHNEAKEWEHLKHLEFSIVTGNLKQRIKALKTEADVYVINRENVTWLIEYFGNKFPFDMLVVDESSSFKSPSSRRFRALKKLLPHIKYSTILTGTPTPNGYLDLWSQVYIIDGGRRLGRNITMFRNSYFNKHPSGFGYIIKEGSAEKIQEKIKDKILSIETEGNVELPPYTSSVLDTPLPPKLLARYKKFEQDMIMQIEETELTAMSSASLSNKLLQFSSGAVYDDDKNVHYIHDLKFDTLDEIIEDNPHDNLLIAYNYKHELERLIGRYPQAVKLDKEGKAVKDWNDGKIKMLLAHPACLTEDVEVLTEFSGWVKITDVKITDRVYDGVEFVSHNGCQYSGYKDVIDVFGIEMTPEHKLLINGEWVEAKDVRASRQESGYRYNGSDKYLCEMLQMSDRVPNEELKVWGKQNGGEKKTNKKHVYDLVDCGSRTRFLIRNKDKEVFISHNSAGHGLNLQHGGSIVVWLGFNWSLELYQQFNKRLHRQGQKNPVRCLHIAVGQVEYKLMRALDMKETRQTALLQALQNVIGGN